MRKKGHVTRDAAWQSGEESEDAQGETSDSSNDEENDPSTTIPMRFEQLTREFDVKFYTGLPSTQAFKCLFE